MGVGYATSMLGQMVGEVKAALGTCVQVWTNRDNGEIVVLCQPHGFKTQQEWFWKVYKSVIPGFDSLEVEEAESGLLMYFKQSTALVPDIWKGSVAAEVNPGTTTTSHIAHIFGLFEGRVMHAGFTDQVYVNHELGIILVNPLGRHDVNQFRLVALGGILKQTPAQNVNFMGNGGVFLYDYGDFDRGYSISDRF